MQNKTPENMHIVRFGTAADQKYLLDEYLNTYGMLIINANILAHMPSALASFLSVRAGNKPYFIDPQTHAFQHDVAYIESSSEKRKGEIKTSIQKLADAYGNPVQLRIQKHNSVIPSDFKNASAIKEFCERVIGYQLNTIPNEIKKSDTEKYFRYLKQEDGAKLYKVGSPHIIVAPYFYMTSNTIDDWIEVNIKCASESKNISFARNGKVEFAIQIVISRELLANRDKLNLLIDRYKSVNPNKFLIWIDSFSEQEASEEELNNYVYYIKELGKAAPVINLYGGYFSVMLYKCKALGCLKGVSHGLEYGESRGVVPVGGGIPTAKYYFPILHTRLSFRDALRAIRAVGGMNSVSEFYKNVCDCKMCKSIIKRDPENDFQEYGKSRNVRFARKGLTVNIDYPLPKTKDNSVRHYMWCKYKEYNEKCDLESFKNECKSIKLKLERAIGLENIAHCNVWLRVLENINK